MAIFNLFKISNLKKDNFFNIYRPDNNEKTKLKTLTINDEQVEFFVFSDIESAQPTNLNWNWLVQQTELPMRQIFKSPKAILYTIYNDDVYALSFGMAYLDVDKYADKDFAFKFARKFNYKKIKSTSLINPNSNKSKTIVSYVDNEYFEYDTGGAYLKIKGQVVLDNDFDLFKSSIEVGTSIKLSVDNPSLEKFFQIVKYVNNRVLTINDLSRIPLFQQIKDKNKLNELDEYLKNNFDIESCNISFSDFDIIGTNEVFYSQTASNLVSCNGKRECLDYLTIDNIKTFCEKKGIDYKENFFDIKVKVDETNKAFSLKELIDYPIENENCVLIKGEWYQYNNDFVESLRESLIHLDCKYDSKFNWDEQAYNQFIETKKTEYRAQDEYKNFDDGELTKEVKKKYYKEMVYNKIMAEKYDFDCGDRCFVKIGSTSNIELYDLYKDGCIYAVKIGNSSGKLCYCVDQMTTAMNSIKNHAVNFDKEVKDVCVVLILKKQQKYPNETGYFDADMLGYIALKNALNNWMREARNLFYNPHVIIGYSDFS